jgi:hypothetical protein
MFSKDVVHCVRMYVVVDVRLVQQYLGLSQEVCYLCHLSGIFSLRNGTSVLNSLKHSPKPNLFENLLPM